MVEIFKVTKIQARITSVGLVSGLKFLIFYLFSKDILTASSTHFI